MNTKNDIAAAIAEELLNDDVLDVNNFNGDMPALLNCVRETVMKNLRDFIIVSGRLIP